MKTVPKVEDPLLQKFHYDQAQRMLLSTFIAGLSGNLGRQVRFQMPSTADLALQIAIKVFEAEAQEKRNLAFFSKSETPRKGRGNFGQPWKTFGRSEHGQAAHISTDAPHVDRKQSQQNARRQTLAVKGNCFVLLSVGNQDILPKNAFQIDFPPARTRGRISTPNHRKRESQATLMLKLHIETPIVRKTCS